MAKKKQTDPKAETAARIKRTEAYAERVRALFAATVNQILALNKTIPTLKPGVMFSFDDKANRKIAEQTERLLRRLHSAVTTSIETGITLEWDTANDECDELISSIFGKHVLKNENFRGWMERNNDARREFIARTERGLNLSKRVWKTTRQLRDEMEVAMTVAIGEGESAASMSRKVRQYLNDPDLMFRRFRYKDENGNWQRKWKKRVMDANTGKYSWIDYDKDSYHDQWTGKGYYKSSAKNAMRVTRTETNMAYRAADTSRWKQLDFILGIHIQPSASHPQPDICDELAGDYPKTFKFTGWHPQCFCVMTPILPSNEEMLAMADTRANGEEYIPQTPAITQYPTGFNNFVKSNAENIKAARERGTEPYFLRENAGVVNGILNPPKTLTPQEIALERHAKRDVAKVQQSWNEHRINNIETSVQKGYLPKECLSGLSALSQEAFNARIISLQKTALRHTARTPEEINDIQKRWTAKQQRDATTKLVANNVLKLRSEYPLDVDFSSLEKLLADNNLTKMREEARNVAKTIKSIIAEEKTLSRIIPNAHSWHKKFTLTDLRTVYDNVEKKLTSLSGLSLAEQKKKLEFEISYVANPGAYKSGAKQYPTWEVAQDAYGKALADVNYKIAVENITNQLKVVEKWSLAHPKSKNVANYLLEAKTAILNKEPLPSLQAKAQKAILEHQKRLAEQARRDAKKSGAISLNDISVADQATLYDEFENKLTVAEVDKAMRKETEAAWIKFDTEERMLCTKYTQSYCYLNEPLRNMIYSGGRSSNEYNNDMPKLTKALQKVRTTKNMVVRRGTGNYTIPELGKSLSDVNPGDEFIDGAFLSTACHPTKGFFDSLNMIIYVPKGAEGIFAEPFTHYNDSGCYDYSSNLWDGKEKKSIGGEFEWIGQRGSRFRVIRKTGNTIHLLLIGQRYKQPIK